MPPSPTSPKSHDQLNQTVRENRTSINNIVNNVERISGRSEPQIAQILENVRVITGEVRTIVAEPGGDVKGSMGSLRQTMERVNRASVDLESALNHIDNVTGRIDRGEGTVGRLTKDETLINEVEDVVEGVGDIVGGIGRLQTVVALRNDYNFQANSVKSYVELRLQPREDKYYLIELINDPRGLTDLRTDHGPDRQPKRTSVLSGSANRHEEPRCVFPSSSRVV